MLTLEEAKAVLLMKMPVGTVIKGVYEMAEEFLFLAPGPDASEGRFDPFLKVHKLTNVVTDFSPQDYDNPLAILEQLNPQL